MHTTISRFKSPVALEAAWRLTRLALGGFAALLLVACAHPISIEPNSIPERGAQLSAKKAVYVISAADRQKQVTTEGGGGDKVTYFPYKDFERSLRAALGAVYSDVSVVSSISDKAAIRESGASYIFVPEITTASSSTSALTWPPTSFSVNVVVDVFDANAAAIAKLRVNGNGNAVWADFKGDFGLAGRRAVEDAARLLVQEILRTEKLR
jgi:hypothetical protein